MKLIRLVASAMGFYFILVSTTYADTDISIQNSDAEVLGILSIIDQNEIQAAQLAEAKRIDPQVLDYARMLDTEHNKNLDNTRKLSQELALTIVDTHSVDQLRAQGKQDLAALGPLDGATFARLYIADMIKGHSAVLNWMDTQDTHHEQVKDFFKDSREHFIMHLKKAQKIQESQQLAKAAN